MKTTETNELTKREYFAAMALQGRLAQPDALEELYELVTDENGETILDEHGEEVTRVCKTEFQQYADYAVEMADALIAALNEGENE